MFQKCRWHIDLPKWGPWRFPWGHDTLKQQHVPRHHKTKGALPPSLAAGWPPSLTEAWKTIGCKGSAFFSMVFHILVRTRQKWKVVQSWGTWERPGGRWSSLNPHMSKNDELARNKAGPGLAQIDQICYRTAWSLESHGAGQPRFNKVGKEKKQYVGTLFVKSVWPFVFNFLLQRLSRTWLGLKITALGQVPMAWWQPAWGWLSLD